MTILLVKSGGRDGKGMTGGETMFSLHNLIQVADGRPYERGNSMGTMVHGINIDQLVGTINAIKENPDLARFQFRAVTEWVDGGHSRTKIQGFYGAGAEDASRNSPFVLEGDEPPVLLGSNVGPNAVETVLSALASCLTVGIVYNAAARDIEVESLSFSMQGDIDLHGFLGLSDRVRPGYQNIRLSCRVKSDASREKLEELWAYVQRTSPVLDIVRNPVPVSLTIENA
ncbi:MAG TPA: OsmC family protein [Candidatus Deferrimicrobiaceae bacterium]|nr:OsmC family protein [Candidatus Deferrimicrobiaceae bacterium]